MSLLTAVVMFGSLVSVSIYDLRGSAPLWVLWSVIGVPTVTLVYLAWWPVVKLPADGALLLRGWTRIVRAHASEVTNCYMTGYGLRINFAEARGFTCVIFQATGYSTYPWYLDAVEAITGTRPPLDVQSPDFGSPRIVRNPEARWLDYGTVDGLAEIVESNRELVKSGEYRRALQRMRDLLRTHSDDLELRRAVAQLYRELGNPDQAGRWGFVVPDGATEFERDMFLRGARSAPGTTLRRLLLLPDDFPLEIEEGNSRATTTRRAGRTVPRQSSSVFALAAVLSCAIGVVLSVVLVAGIVLRAPSVGLPLPEFAAVGSRGITIIFGAGAVLGGLSSAVQAHFWTAAPLFLAGGALIYIGVIGFGS